MLPSKVYESFVLNWLSTEVSCKTNQYGGVKGCGVNHLLVELWDQICNNLEDARAATTITAIDYAKAFNRLSFQHCLMAFARKGASSQTIRLLATFLSNRTMTVRVNNTWSDPLPVYGGVPQGTILGVMLFNVATDDLEDAELDCRALVASRSSSGGDPEDDSTTDSPTGWSEPYRSDLGYEDNLLLDSTMDRQDTPIMDRPAQSVINCSALNPDAPEFVPRQEYGPSAGHINITDYLLGELPGSGDNLPDTGAEHFEDEINLDYGAALGESLGEDWTWAGGWEQHEEPGGFGRYEDGEPLADEDTTGSLEGTGIMASTPVRDPDRGELDFDGSPVRANGPRLGQRDWSYLPGERNVRRGAMQRRIEYSDEGELSIVAETNKKRTGLRWKSKQPASLKFVDDNVIVSKTNMDSAEQVPGGREKKKHEVQTQNVFRRVVRRAESRGMVVNKGKTHILCVSDALNYKATVFIEDSDGNRVESGEKLKILGFHLDSRPGIHAHVEALKKRMRETTWILRHLRLAGFNTEELATVYRYKTHHPPRVGLLCGRLSPDADRRAGPGRRKTPG